MSSARVQWLPPTPKSPSCFRPGNVSSVTFEPLPPAALADQRGDHNGPTCKSEPITAAAAVTGQGHAHATQPSRLPPILEMLTSSSTDYSTRLPSIRGLGGAKEAVLTSSSSSSYATSISSSSSSSSSTILPEVTSYNPFHPILLVAMHVAVDVLVLIVFCFNI
jgi:hypothetical protein